MTTTLEKVEVAELLARYSRCLDSGDVEGYVQLFAPDGVLDGAAGPRTGHEAIRQVARAIADALTAPGSAAAGQRHISGPPLIEGDDRQCEVRSSFMLLRQREGAEAFIRAVGEYTDTCVKIDERWVFARRHIQLLLGQFG
jgi:3-phenylpropionate/cinnamic acid dioxygenase small subunit